MSIQTTNKQTLQNGKIYFENLDFLRFIACMVVFTGHAAPQFLKSISTSDWYQRIVSLATDGGLAVSFFFVLSGFLITYLLLKENEKTGTILLKNFYLRRLLRIWPLYLSVVFFGFYIYPFVKGLIGMNSNIPNNPLFYFSFLTNFDSIRLKHLGILETSSPEMLAVTWSVAIEEQFYLVWPLLFLLTPKKYHKYILFATIAISSAFRFLHRNDQATLYFHTVSVMSDLAIGGLTAYYTLFSTRYVNFLSTLKRPYILFVYILGLILLLAKDYISSSLGYTVIADFRILSAIFFAFIINEQNLAQNSFVKFSKFKTLSDLGKYSYSLYLLHPIGMQVTIILFKLLHITNKNLALEFLYTALSLIFSLTLSFLSFHFLERPFLQLKTKFES